MRILTISLLLGSLLSALPLTASVTLVDTNTGGGCTIYRYDNDMDAQAFVGTAKQRVLEVVVRMGSSGGDPLVQIYDDNAGEPGSSLVTLTPSGPLAGKANYTFTPSSELILEDGERYWLVVDNNNAGSFSWEYYCGLNFSTSTPGHDPRSAYSGNGGASWGVSADNYPYAIEVTVSPPIKEFSGWAYMANYPYVYDHGESAWYYFLVDAEGILWANHLASDTWYLVE